MVLCPYIEFTQAEWAELRADTPLTLTRDDLAKLQGVNEEVSLSQVEGIYLPLSRLLSLYVESTQHLYRQTNEFFGEKAGKVPYLIGLAGSVAVGKSTTGRVLRELLARWQSHPKVELITTDGFLLPNSELERRGLMARKGFPESYDRRGLVQFVSDIKAGVPCVESPVYSHLTYDIVPGQTKRIEAPDIVIVEGLNILQYGPGQENAAFVSDFLDFTIYVDAAIDYVRRWYVERFLMLRSTAFRDPNSYFRHYAELSDTEASDLALQIWRDINEANLHENIEPTRERADLILEKGDDHAVEKVRLRKI